jgi:ADP-heptose:LPS heptosyltransferase
VAAPERWDEACFSVPAVRALAATGFDITILHPKHQTEFWAVPPACMTLPYPAKTSARALAALIGTGWDAAMIWEEGVAADACAHAKIIHRSGPALKGVAKRLTHPVAPEPPGPVVHRVRHYLSLVEALGIETRVPGFFAPGDLGIERESGTVLLSPDSDFGRSHEWPLVRWEEIAWEIAAHTGKRLTVATVPGGGGQAAKLAATLGEAARFVELDPLGGALTLLAAHQLVVGADGSLPHLAARVGTTCVTLFGPNDPTWKRPLGKQHAVARHHVECTPCFAAKCPLDLRCQNELTTERVLSDVVEKLGWAPGHGRIMLSRSMDWICK